MVAHEALVLPLFYEESYRIARPELEGLSLSLGFPTVPSKNCAYVCNPAWIARCPSAELT